MKRRTSVRCLVVGCKLVVVAIGLAVMIVFGAVHASAMGSARTRHLPARAPQVASTQPRSLGGAMQQTHNLGYRAASAGMAVNVKRGTAPRMAMSSMRSMSGMGPMQCMSEMQTMMASMGSMHHMMSMHAMMTMMASMHLPRHATHAQCMRAMQTMMARMHPMGQVQTMRMMQPVYYIVQPVYVMQSPSWRYVG